MTRRIAAVPPAGGHAHVHSAKENPEAESSGQLPRGPGREEARPRPSSRQPLALGTQAREGGVREGGGQGLLPPGVPRPSLSRCGVSQPIL